jgi:hypothetical protein
MLRPTFACLRRSGYSQGGQPTRITDTCYSIFRKMGRGGRFGKYGEVKRFERLRQKRRGLLPLKPLKKLSLPKKIFQGLEKSKEWDAKSLEDPTCEAIRF